MNIATIAKTALDWFGGAAVSLPLTAAFLAVTDRRRFRRKWFWVVLFVLYLNALFIITGVPDAAHLRWEPVLLLDPLAGFSAARLKGTLLNVALFVPFGGFITLYFGGFRNWKRALAAGFLLSLFIETLQLAAPRTTDVCDLIANTLGALAGHGLARLLFGRLAEKRRARDTMKLTAMILLTLLTVVLVRYPLMDWLYAHVL